MYKVYKYLHQQVSFAYSTNICTKEVLFFYTSGCCHVGLLFASKEQKKKLASDISGTFATCSTLFL